MEHIEGRNHSNRRLSITKNIVACMSTRSYDNTKSGDCAPHEKNFRVVAQMCRIRYKTDNKTTSPATRDANE